MASLKNFTLKNWGRSDEKKGESVKEPAGPRGGRPVFQDYLEKRRDERGKGANRSRNHLVNRTRREPL